MCRPPAFEVGYGVETDEPDRFKALFRSGHVCFELSTAPTDDLATTGGVPCWSLFHAARKPTFSGLGDAFRTLRGWLVHPDTKSIIPESACALRAVVTYATSTPDGDDYTAEAPPDDGAAAGWEEYFDADYGADYYFHRPTNETTWALPRRFPAPRREAPTTWVDLDIDGVRRVFPAVRGTDAAVAATRICKGYGILNWHCIDAITEKIQTAFARDDAGPQLPAPPRPPRPPADPATPADAAPADAPALPNPLAADARALPPPEKTPMERLVELKTIFEAGLVSEDEMQAKRDAILATM